MKKFLGICFLFICTSLHSADFLACLLCRRNAQQTEEIILQGNVIIDHTKQTYIADQTDEQLQQLYKNMELDLNAKKEIMIPVIAYSKNQESEAIWSKGYQPLDNNQLKNRFVTHLPYSIILKMLNHTNDELALDWNGKLLKLKCAYQGYQNQSFKEQAKALYEKWEPILNH